MEPFLTDIRDIRKRARASIAEGAVTDAYKADRERVVTVLNQALATEIVCTLRYKFHYLMASGISSEAVKAEFLEHAVEEQEHADRLALRIVQLNGKPDLNPANLTARSHSEYVEGNSLVAMIEEDLVAERVAIETYCDIIRWLGDADPTSSRLLKEILEKEEEHAEDLSSLLQNAPASP